MRCEVVEHQREFVILVLATNALSDWLKVDSEINKWLECPQNFLRTIPWRSGLYDIVHYPTGTSHQYVDALLPWENKPRLQWCSHTGGYVHIVRYCFVEIIGPNMVQISLSFLIIQSPLSYICPSVHPGAIDFVQNRYIRTQLSTSWNKKRKKN